MVILSYAQFSISYFMPTLVYLFILFCIKFVLMLICNLILCILFGQSLPMTSKQIIVDLNKGEKKLIVIIMTFDTKKLFSYLKTKKLVRH